MEPKIWIKEIEFSDGSKLSFDQSDIVVFVGANNAGKSASLKESYALLQSENYIGKVIRAIKISKQGSLQDAVKLIESISIKRMGGHAFPHYEGLGFNVYGGAIENFWKGVTNTSDDVTRIFAKNLTTESRLGAANPASNIRLTAEPAKHPINLLQKSDVLEKQFSTYFKSAFNADLIVHRNAGSEVPLYVGKAPVPQSGQDRLSKEYQDEIEKMDLLHQQGDGMRSFVGVLLNAIVSFYSILFIDEPEAFLHPPQARLLGKMLAKDLPSNRQLFLATHSVDFLQGVLEANTSNLKVIRIERDGAVNHVRLLNNTDIKTFWNDSLLRHSNVLDGLFHTQVIVCESDADSRFYSAVLSAIHEKADTFSPDTLFINCGGKHRIPVVVKALKKLNVKIKVVADFDVLNDKSPLKEIYEEAGGNWSNIERDWKEVKSSVDSKRPELEAKELKEEIDKVFASFTDKIVAKEKIAEISGLLKKASAWAHAKQVGKAFIPSGNPTQAFERLNSELRTKAIFIVEEGEQESFVRSIGGHGPKWVNDVLLRDLKNDPELETARRFVDELSSL